MKGLSFARGLKSRSSGGGWSGVGVGGHVVHRKEKIHTTVEYDDIKISGITGAKMYFLKLNGLGRRGMEYSRPIRNLL